MPRSPGRRRSRRASRCRSRSVRSRISRMNHGPDGAVDAGAVGRIFREESGRSVAALIRFCGDIDIAEDAVQEAYAVALRRWPEEGLPPNPGGWITTTARTRALDRLRRETRGRELLGQLALSTGTDDPGPTEE